MEIRSFVAPVIQDREALEEFADALNDRAPEIERDVARLKETPLDKEITASLSEPSTTSKATLHSASLISVLPSPTRSKR